MAPSHESLESNERAAQEIDDRLVKDGQLFLQRRAPKIRFELEMGEHCRVHVVLELFVTVLALRLRAVHGEVGVAQQLLAGAAGGSERHSDARGSEHTMRANDEGLAE